MITDARALEPTYVPRDLEHRDGAISQIAGALRPITGGVAGDHTMIFGPAGSGKTTIAKFVVRQLQQEAFDVTRAYWNCMAGSSKTDVLYGLTHDAGIGRHLPPNGTTTGQFIHAFREMDGQTVVIIDEVDILEDEALLCGLSDLPTVTLLLITIDEDDFFATHRLDGRVRSRFGAAERVHLAPYSHRQLVDILQARIDAGLRSGAVDAELIQYIADRAAGDAREAIIHLETAVKRAIQAGRQRLTEADVGAVEGDIAADLRRFHVDSLGTHKRLLYDIVDRAGEIPASELHSRYEQQCPTPKATRTRRRYLTLLTDKYGLLEASGNGRGKRYRTPADGW